MSMSDLMTVTVPEGELDGIRVERFTVSERESSSSFRYYGGRGVWPGTYTRLVEGDDIWMSDTNSERRDHMAAVHQIRSLKARRVLLNGLGLGMVLQAALSFEHVEHVDVVEKDERIIKLVGPHYEADKRVVVHHADAYEQVKRWPKGARWDVGWSDIWGDVSSDDWPDMNRMNRSYGQRCTWHRCWFQDEVQEQARHTRAEDRRYAEFFG